MFPVVDSHDGIARAVHHYPKRMEGAFFREGLSFFRHARQRRPQAAQRILKDAVFNMPGIPIPGTFDGALRRAKGEREAGGAGIPFELILPQGALVLRYLIAFNFLFGTLHCFKQALRGLGDTSFFLKTALFFDVLFFIPGIFLVVHFFGNSLAAIWNFLLVYLALVSVAYYLRFRSGHWRTTDRGELKETA